MLSAITILKAKIEYLQTAVNRYRSMNPKSWAFIIDESTREIRELKRAVAILRGR